MSNGPNLHFAGELTVCAACAEPIQFLTHERTGKLSPITIASYPNGNIVEIQGNKYRVYGPDSARELRDIAGQKLRLNHFVNCSSPDRFGGTKR